MVRATYRFANHRLTSGAVSDLTRLTLASLRSRGDGAWIELVEVAGRVRSRSWYAGPVEVLGADRRTVRRACRTESIAPSPAWEAVRRSRSRRARGTNTSTNPVPASRTSVQTMGSGRRGSCRSSRTRPFGRSSGRAGTAIRARPNYVADTLIKRRDKVVRHWLNQVNPIENVTLDASGDLYARAAAGCARREESVARAAVLALSR